MPDSFSFDKPLCIAIIIFNELIEDKRTNNKTLVNLFNRITAQTLPATHPRMFLMASLTNLRGKIPISFRVRDPKMQPLMRVDGQINSTDPIQVVDMVVEVAALQLPEAGVYYVDVLAGEEILNSRRFEVLVAPPAPPTPPAG